MNSIKSAGYSRLMLKCLPKSIIQSNKQSYCGHILWHVPNTIGKWHCQMMPSDRWLPMSGQSSLVDLAGHKSLAPNANVLIPNLICPGTTCRRKSRKCHCITNKCGYFARNRKADVDLHLQSSIGTVFSIKYQKCTKHWGERTTVMRWEDEAWKEGA
jgi:hypothetical protein